MIGKSCHRIWAVVCPAMFLALTVSAAPVITTNGVVNASGYQNTLAPDTVFVIFGSGLGPSTIATAPAANYPNVLAKTSIAFTPAKGGAPIAAKVVYSLATQVAGLLPSSIVPGDYAVTVTYNGVAGAAQTVTVVARSFGIATVNTAGSGPAQATIGNVNNGISLVRFTSGSVDFSGYSWSLTPAHPGDTLVLWGTGGGADAANDTGGSSGDQTAAGNFKVLVGGTEITPLYAGASSGYPGLWQINFTLPAGIAPDCFAHVQVNAGGVLSNSATIAIAGSGQSACSSGTLSRESLAKLDAGGTVTGGGFSLIKMTATNSFVLPDGTKTPVQTATSETGGGSIGRYSPAAMAEINSGIHIDKCIVFQKTAFQTHIGIGLPDSFLDAGATLPIGGPGAAANTALVRLSDKQYGVVLPASAIVGGTYTISGNGGPDVGPFSYSIDIPGDFAATNFDSIKSINRNQPLNVTWTGGGSGSVVVGGVFQSTISGSGADPATWKLQATSFYCTVPAAQGEYTVPVGVLALLPPSSFDLTSGNQAYLSVEATRDVEHSAVDFPLTSGGQTDWGSINYTIGVTKNLPVLP